MKRWIACLAPWMVLASAAHAAKLDQANVQFTYNAPSTTDAYRVGDQCYITPKLAKSWEWNVSVRGDEMQIAAEGRLFRVPILREDGMLLLSLTESARFLGAATEWEGDTYRVLGRIRNVELTEQGLVVDSTIKVKTNFFRLSAPDRLVVDFIGGKMDVSDDLDIPAWWRVGQYNPNTARVVFEHPAAVAIATAKPEETRQFVLPLPAVARQNPNNITGTIVPARDPNLPTPRITLNEPEIENDYNAGTLLTIQASKKLEEPPAIQYIGPTQLQISLPDAAFKESVTKQFASSRWISSYMTSADGNRAVLILQTKRAMAFSAATSGSQIRIRVFVPPSSGKLAGKVIVVDAGHGGKDSGSSYAGVTEKSLTLPISQALRDALTNAGASVIMTRDDDTYPSLGARADVANRSNAAAFVSIHINSIQKADSRSGGMTFFHQDDPVDRLLAECIQSEIAKVSKIPDLGTWSDRRIYQSGFKVLRDSTVPSVLIELGFINHKHDRAQMTSKDFPEKIAAAVLRGIQIFLGDKS